ncbi:MAG: hypothetical protein PHW93_05030, partial [Candidatus Methanomethylophilaceae archaeon]|nr:hypothetical protein [Candidatus Methanomethylophilaceae archaeon]
RRVNQIDFVMDNDFHQSFGTVGVAVTLTEAATQQTHIVNGSDVTLRWVSQDAAAWAQWAETIHDSIPANADFDYDSGNNTVTLTISNVYSLQYTMVKTQMVLE